MISTCYLTMNSDGIKDITTNIAFKCIVCFKATLPLYKPPPFKKQLS